MKAASIIEPGFVWTAEIEKQMKKRAEAWAAANVIEPAMPQTRAALRAKKIASQIEPGGVWDAAVEKRHSGSSRRLMVTTCWQQQRQGLAKIGC